MQFLDLNWIAFSGILIALSSAAMAAVMLAVGSSPSHRLWALFCLAVGVWGGSFYFIATTSDPDAARTWWKISHVGVALIPVFFTHFVFSFLGYRRPRALVLLYAAAAFFIAADLFTDLLIRDMRFVFDQFYYDSPPAPLYYALVAFFQILVLYAHALLFRAYVRSTDFLTRERIRYFFMATLVGFLGGGLSFFPVFGIDIYPATIATVTLYPVIMGYAMLHFRLFNVKIVAAQILTLTIIVFTAVRFALADTLADRVLDGFLLAVTAILGVYLVRSVLHEVVARERVEELAKDLSKANARLKELDRLKSEFVSIASHQLRSPLTAIKGYASLILEGSFGAVPPALREAVQRIFESSRLMAISVEDFLNVSRIEQGRMKYEFSDADFREIVRLAISEMRPLIEERGLSLSVTLPDDPLPIRADVGKLAQVVANLIDNAVKYTPRGSIALALARRGGVVRLSIADTGVGISPDAVPKLFDRFVRARNANQVNVSGTGLGLYVAKQFVEAHRGKIWVESPGEGRGSTFFVEIPAR